MEPDDVFPDDMEVCRPPFFFFSLTYREIAKEGIIPYIGHLLRIKWEWYTELIALTRDREIIESSLHELSHLRISAMGCDEVWMRGIKFAEKILVLRESEKIIFLLQLLEWLIRVIWTDHRPLFFYEI